MKFYTITDKTDSDVLGGPVSEHNVYISAYADPGLGKHPRDLEIGEHTWCTYSLSGSKGTYKVTRIEDR